MLKIVTIVGARPQFIKAAAVSRVIRDQYPDEFEEIIVHTGQHFDENMSRVFFDDLDIPEPKFNLEISGGSHGAMTGRMLESIEQVLVDEKPDWVLIYGDTNSTLAGALAASKLHIPVAHVEAGLRSFNMRMPEEINRILADRVSTLLFCPTDTAVKNLEEEGFKSGVHNVGDVMYDAALFYRARAERHSNIHQKLGLEKGRYVLATCHRAENTDNRSNLSQILDALVDISKDAPVVLPIHPRTAKLIVDYGFQEQMKHLLVAEPQPFLDMIALERDSKVILTDSGGVQKEALFYGVPCITMREETEWVETVELGCNFLAGASRAKIIDAYNRIKLGESKVVNAQPYGAGNAASGLLKIMSEYAS